MYFSPLVPVVLDVLGKQDLHEEVYAYLKCDIVPYVRPENMQRVLIPYLIDRIR